MTLLCVDYMLVISVVLDNVIFYYKVNYYTINNYK